MNTSGAAASPSGTGASLAVAQGLAAAGYDVLLPDWPAPAWVSLLTIARDRPADRGSRPTQFAGGDSNGKCRTRRRRLAGVLPSEPAWLNQVHGAQAIVLDAEALSAARATAPIADAAVTRLPGVIWREKLTADCLPVAITDRQGSAIGIAHAGWRGLAAGVLEATVAAMVDQGVAASDMMVWFGPAIGPASFEVGADVMTAFCASDPGAATCFAPRPHRPEKWLADLYALARRRLAKAGVRAIYGGGLCTYADAVRFPSYRRDRTAERMTTLLWLAEARGNAAL